MSASRLGQAARKLAQEQFRGLANALSEASVSSSGLRQQPMSAMVLRQHSSLGATQLATEALKSAESAAGIPGPSSQLQQQQAADAAATAGDATDFSKKDLVMIFTCVKCNTRAAKAFSKRSYIHGVVIVDCPGCHSKHLIADHLGWFGQKGTVEEFAAEKGSMVVRKLADGTMELTPEDIMGSSLLHEVGGQQAAAPAAAVVDGGPQQ